MVDVAIVGATGLVGRTIVKVLEERSFPVGKLALFASAKSKGKSIEFKGKEIEVEELTEESFSNHKFDLALFSASADISKKYALLAKRSGCVVIDNSSAFRMEKSVPLVVHEVNPFDIFTHDGIIANPNCSTIQAVVPLKVLDDAYKLKRVVYATYQAVSGSGQMGINDLEYGTTIKYPYSINDNLIPQIDVFLENGYTKEEIKMIEETRKILHLPQLSVTATAVRVPIKNCHSVMINAELENDFELQDVFKLFKNQPGIILLDDIKNLIYPMPVLALGKDEVFTGRIRRDYSVPYGLNLFTVADNIRKGAATNAVQIAEILIKG